MTSQIDGQTIRQTLLTVVEEFSTQGPGFCQSGAVLQEVMRRLGTPQSLEVQQALLTFWSDLFREGQLSWGYNLANPSPPFFHVSELGRATLQQLSRDPANPDGYLAHLKKETSLTPIAWSYLSEALRTYNAGCIKATAVMVGVAAESIVLELRDGLAARITTLGRSPSGNLKDWRTKRILDAIKDELDKQKNAMPGPMAEIFEAYWPAFTQQIRAVRNDAGHPSSVDSVTPEAVHASLLIFPELARLTANLKLWIGTGFK